MKKLTKKIITALCIISLIGGMTACGQSAGKKGVGFEELGFVCNAEENVEYDYVSCFSDDTSREVVMKALFSDYEIYPHPEKDGYELRSVKLTLTLENLNENASATNRCTAYLDYYSLNSETERSGDNVDSTNGTETIVWDGAEYEITYSSQLTGRTYSDDGNTGYMQFFYEYEVPANYDGVVIALYNHANSEKGTHIVENYDEDTLFFRLNNKEGEERPKPENVTEVTPKGEVVHVESEYMKFDMFVHDDKYIGSNDILAGEFFYIPEGKTVTREDITGIFDVENYYNESQEYTNTTAGELFTMYVMNSLVDLEHLTEDYMWNTFVECFNTMSYNEICAFIDEPAETSEDIVKRYACECIKIFTEGYIWSK